MTLSHCPCGSGQPLETCCTRMHRGQLARTPGELMRSRYSAYVLGEIDYLIQTTLPAQQAGLDRAGIQLSKPQDRHRLKTASRFVCEISRLATDPVKTSGRFS